MAHIHLFKLFRIVSEAKGAVKSYPREMGVNGAKMVIPNIIGKRQRRNTVTDEKRIRLTHPARDRAH